MKPLRKKLRWLCLWLGVGTGTGTTNKQCDNTNVKCCDPKRQLNNEIKSYIVVTPPKWKNKLRQKRMHNKKNYAKKQKLEAVLRILPLCISHYLFCPWFFHWTITRRQLDARKYFHTVITTAREPSDRSLFVWMLLLLLLLPALVLVSIICCCVCFSRRWNISFLGEMLSILLQCVGVQERGRGGGGRAVLCLPHSHFVQFCLQLSSERTFCIKRVNNIPIVEVWICCCLLGHTIVWLVPNCLLGNSHVFKYVKTIRFFLLSFQKCQSMKLYFGFPECGWTCVCVSVYKCKTYTHTLKEKSCKSYINHSLRWGNGCATFLLFLFRFPIPCIQRSRDWPNVYYTDRLKK